MPFTAQEISDAGLSSLDHYLRNHPVDQIAVERPLLRKLKAQEKEFPGGKQYVVEQLRKTYNSNFQWYYGSQQVTYNNRQTLEQANFAWRGAHDGYFLDEDRLLQNGIAVSDDGKPGQHSASERLMLTNLFEEQNEVLRLGFEEAFDQALHLDGTQDTEALEGLDHLVSLTPSTGTVGGIDASASANSYWRNSFVGSLTSSTIIANMETQWRNCVRNGGRPDYIIAGEDFIDEYRTALLAAGEYQLASSGVVKYDGGVGMKTMATETGLAFKGVPIVWDPVAADLDAAYSPATDWVDRCYFLNCKQVRLRPASGHNMIKRKPPREYDRYVHYFAATWKGAFTINRRNATALLVVT